MFELVRINPSDIPLEIKNLIAMDIPYYAVKSPYRNSIVCWFKSNIPRQQIEREFDLTIMQEISGAERLNSLPDIEDFFLQDTGHLVKVNHAIKTEGNCVFECYEIYSHDGTIKIIDSEEKLYSCFKSPAKELCAKEVKQAQFPDIYAKWPVADKVNYWVGNLYRFRRQVGESGQLEDTAFSPDLIEKMRKIDIDFENILPSIMAGLATMENDSQSRLALAFTLRTGVNAK